MEAHILDGRHFLVETHAEESARLMVEFNRRTPTLSRQAEPLYIAAFLTTMQYIWSLH
jgi:hypothetical protein